MEESVVVRILHGDCRTILKALPSESVHTVVTSPPYFGLRDYGVAGQIGCERTCEGFVSAIVDVFREVRPVLRFDGTAWLNIGDTFVDGEALMVPARVALALRADGWKLHQENIWHKPNAKGEGQVSRRCTRAHEYVYLLSRTGNYYFNADAIAEPATGTDDRPQQRRAKELARQANLTEHHFAAIRACGATDAGKAQETHTGFGRNSPEVARLAAEAKAALGGYYREFLMAPTKNRRSVWPIPTQPSRERHHAMMPEALAEICVLAGSPPGGMVLDPFAGIGTTGVVANRLGRNAILVELNPEYAAAARSRIGPLLTDVA